MFHTENEKIVVFEAPFGGLRATYAVHLRLIGKLVGDFLLVARCFRFVTIHAFDRQTDGQTLVGKTALHTMQRGKNWGFQFTHSMTSSPIFTALQLRKRDLAMSVCPSLCLSVCRTRGLCQKEST